MKLTIENMSCKHCVAKIEKTLLLNQVKATVHLEDKSVTLNEASDLEKAKTLLSQIGYPAK